MEHFEAIVLKPHLRYKIGDVVYLQGDISKKCPMTITSYLIHDDYADYGVRWPNSQNTMETDCLPDVALTN